MAVRAGAAVWAGAAAWAGAGVTARVGAAVWAIGFSEPMQNDYTCFYSEIILKFIIIIIISI